MNVKQIGAAAVYTIAALLFIAIVSGLVWVIAWCWRNT